MADEKRSFESELSPPTALSENPQEDWGEPADEGAAYSANHARRGAKTDAERSQGAKTRKATKDAISRRV
jgi:hypothetical protein